MILKEESYFRRIPHGWDRKKTLFYDAIGYSIEMADMAHIRLQDTLLQLASRHDKNKDKMADLRPIIISAMLDAWSIVDSVHRLRDLLGQTPGIKQKSPSLVIFYRETQDINCLRNIIQHLNQKLDNFVGKNLPALGALSWLAWLHPNQKWLYTCTLVPGILFGRNDPLINPAGKKVRPPVDCITLDAQLSVNLSAIMNEVQKVASWLEKELGKTFSNLPQAGGDVFYSAEFHFE